MVKAYKAGIVGLGNIGFKFDLDAKREETWSHLGAYTKCASTEVVGTVEVDMANIRVFKEYHPEIPVFGTVRELLECYDLDIVSICTPTELHLSIFDQIAEYPVKAVFCEKPLSSNLEEGKAILNRAQQNKILLSVNHTRRWDSNYVSASEKVEVGEIGQIQSVHGFYPGQVFNVGSHLFDLVRMFVKRDPKVVCGVSDDPNRDDPNIIGWIEFENGIYCSVNCTRKLRNLVFEIDVIGDRGRIRVTENGDKIELSYFQSSSRYSGYEELLPAITEKIEKNDRFVEAIEDIVLVLEGKKKDVRCSGRDGFLSLSMCHSLLTSAQNLSRPVEVRNV